MAALGQGIGPRHHEQRAVEHHLGIKHPGVRIVHRVTGKHLKADQERQPDDKPGKNLANNGRDSVHGEKDFLHGVITSRKQ